MGLKDRNGLTETEFLKQYDPDRYQKPAVTVDMLIFTVNPQKDYSLELLLIERGGHPYLGKWAIPGGFVEMDESLEEAAARELLEETGLSDIYMEQLYSFGDVGRDPRMRVISVAYMALVPKEKLKPVAGDDAAKVRWFSVHWEETEDAGDGGMRLWLESEMLDAESGEEGVDLQEAKSTDFAKVHLEEEDIAFDHEKVIKTALQRMKNKVEYTDIAFELVGEKFTLTQLQMIYEAILGRQLHKPNFRRGIADQVEKTEELETKSSNRPSYLYRKKKAKGGSRYE